MPRSTHIPEAHYQDYYEKQAPPAPAARYVEWLREAEQSVGRGRLLEVGAGSGGFAGVALRRGWVVEATEVSESALALLRDMGMSVFAGDVTDVRYPEGRFDLVVSLEVVEHLPRPLDHLKELRRVTRPGGLLLLTTPNFDGLSRRLLGLRWRVVAPEHLGYFTRRTMAWALRAAGYGHARITCRSLDVTSWRAGTGPGDRQTFDPHSSAALRETVQASTVLRHLKELVNVGLSLTGLGDSLLVWARR